MNSVNPPRLPVWLLPCILVTAVISGYCIYKRTQVESLNKATSMAVEMETVESLAASEGKPVAQALGDLKAQGVNAVVISEETVVDLIGQGRARLDENDLQVWDQVLMGRISRGLATRFGHPLERATFAGTTTPTLGLRIENLPPNMVRQCPIGLNPDQAAQARSAGMIIIARAGNPQGVSADYVQKTLNWMHDLGATVFLPMGDQVLGRRDAIDTTETTLPALGMYYASPEFAKIGGDDEIVKKIPGSVVRLHSAQAAELDKMPLEDAVDRYSKASRERNMRVLLLRPVSFASPDPLKSFADFARQVGDAVRKDGGAIGRPKPFGDTNIPWVVKLLLAMSVVPTAFWVWSVLLDMRRPRHPEGATFADRQPYLIGGLGLVVLAVATKTHIGLAVFALISAIVFPLAAFFVLDALASRAFVPDVEDSAEGSSSMAAGRKPGATKESFGFGVFDVLVLFLLTTAISLVGGFTVAGLLNSLQYFVKAQEFQGIKVAVFLPILVVGVYFLCRFQDMKQAMRNPVTWLAALISLVLLGALLFMNARTGNDNPAGVSDLELKLRNILDAVLFVRPRTKSFLIGHPLLFAGIGFMLWRARRARNDIGDVSEDAPTGMSAVPVRYGVLAALLLTMGAIGQTDVVNTFCHLHTPFMLSLLRTAVAIVPGVILGAVIWILLRRGLRLEGAQADAG